MKPSFVSKILNIFFITLATDVLFFALFRYYFKAQTAIIFASTSSVVVVITIIAIFSHRQKRFGLKQSELNHMESCTKALYFAPSVVSFEFFYCAIKKVCPSATKCKEWVETKTQQILIEFDKKMLDAKWLSEKLRNAPSKTKQKVVFCVAFEEDCASLGVMLLDAPKVYKFLKKTNTFPKVEKKQIAKKHGFHFLDRSKILRYLSLAVLFYFSGKFFGYRSLYFACAICCLAFAFFSLFATKPKEQFVLE